MFRLDLHFILIISAFIFSVDGQLSRAPDGALFCNTSSYSTCGNGFSIRYPFHFRIRGGDVVSDCGYPGFEVDCSGDDGRPKINISNNLYYILSSDVYRLRVVGTDVAEEECPRPTKNFTLDATSPFSLSLYEPYKNITYFYNCSTGYPKDVVQHLPCLDLDAYYNNTTAPPGLRSFAFDNYDIPNGGGYNWYTNCQQTVLVPVADGYYSEYNRRLPLGFDLNWYTPDECFKCEKSGGNCFYNETSGASPLCSCLEEQRMYNGSCPKKGVDDQTKHEILQTLGLEEGNLPVKYLGLPLITKKLSHDDCSPILAKISTRIQGWTLKFLSYAGRLQLVKAVLYSIQNYWLGAFILPKKTIKAIIKLFRNFLWTGNDCTTSHALISWDRICKPYDEGGLGLRDIVLLNKAAILRHLWSIVSNKDTLWVHWATSNLIKSKPFWSMKIPCNASWSWRCMLKGRKDAIHMVKILIGNGNQTKIFGGDPWTSIEIMDHKEEILLADSRLSSNSIVADLITNGDWDIRDSIVRLLPDVAEAIKSTEINSDEEDRPVWSISKDGVYNLKQTYEELREPGAMIDWTRTVWDPCNIPRHSFITWMAFRNALKTKVKTFSWGLTTDTACMLCNTAPETEQHIFLDCHYSSSVWLLIKNAAGYSSGNQDQNEYEWVLERSRGQTLQAKVVKLMFTSFVYHVWKERNRRVFRNQSSPIPLLANEIQTDIRIRLAASAQSLEDSQENRETTARWGIPALFKSKVMKLVCWEPTPLFDWTLNTDGSLANGQGSWGAVIRDYTGSVIAAAHGTSNHTCVPYIEYEALLQGLKMAHSRNCQRLAAQTDSLCVVKFFNNDKVPWEIHRLHKNIKLLSLNFQEIKIHHIYREANSLADRLASSAPSLEFLEIIPSSLSEDIRKIVYEDSSRKMRLRM